MFTEAEQLLRTRLSPERFSHSVRVAKTACEIAKMHRISSVKAYLAGLLHDNAREISMIRQKAMLRNLRVKLRPDEIACPGIWHSFIGELIARKDFAVRDSDILEAIRFHSTGDVAMGSLAMCVYIADFIEPERDGWQDDEKIFTAIRRLALRDLKSALQMTVMMKIQYSLRFGTHILTRGVDLWNALVSRSKKR